MTAPIGEKLTGQGNTREGSVTRPLNPLQVFDATVAALSDRLYARATQLLPDEPIRGVILEAGAGELMAHAFEWAPPEEPLSRPYTAQHPPIWNIRGFLTRGESLGKIGLQRP